MALYGNGHFKIPGGLTVKVFIFAHYSNERNP